MLLPWALRHQCRQQRSHLRQRDTKIDVDIVERALRHAGIGGISRVLNDRHPATPLDGDEARRAVVEHARQHDANDACAMRHGGRAKERIDARSVSVFARALGDQQLSFLSKR